MIRVLMVPLIFFCNVTQTASALLSTDLTQVLHLSPNEERINKITLTNDDDLPLEVKITPSDYIYNAAGENFFSEPGSTKRSNASWIQLSNVYVVIPPHETKEVIYAIHVPNNPNLKGAYWSILLFEPQRKTVQQFGDQGFNLEVKIRYAYQLITEIGSGKSQLKLLNKGILEGDTLSFDVENTGEIYLSPKLVAHLFDKNGKLLKKLETTKQKLLPGTSTRYTIFAKDIPKGNYKTLIVLDNGDKHVFGDRFDLAIP